MMFHILLTCSFVTLVVHGQRFQKSIEAQPRVGYSSSVVHTYPLNNNLHSASSVKVDFHPQQELAIQNSLNRESTKYLQANNNVPNKNFYFDNNSKSTNSFNVGYNISFSNLNIPKKREPIYTQANNKKIEHAEVITGKLKKNEKVRAPTSINLDLSPQDFVSHAFMKQKQINLQNIRHTSLPHGTTNSVKYLNPVREHASRLPSQSPKFTYNTQENIFKDVIKATNPDPIQLNHEFKTSYQTDNRWNNVSPGLEIGRSVEPIISDQSYENIHNPRYTNSRDGQPQNFNHESALKASQSFDFSNAHGEILYSDNNLANDNSAESSENYFQKTKVHGHSTNQNNLDSNLNVQQFPDLGNINIEAHIPVRLRGVKPLPIDTSLLKDAVLTTDFRGTPKDPRIIPIHLDMSNIQAAMQEQLTNVQKYGLQPGTHSPLLPQSSRFIYDDHNHSASQNDFRIYSKPESVDANNYKKGFNYDGKHFNFDNDIYKIVSMRPPPVRQNVKF